MKVDILDIYMTDDTLHGGCSVCVTPIYIKGRGFVPCGKCIECALQYSNVWAYRCSLEARQYEDNCFITLTYNEDNLPVGASLKKRDFQLFFKRLRKKLWSRFAIKVRYFGCGEYGAKRERPHGHFIIFNFFPDDVFKFRVGNKIILRSKLIEECWDKGFVTVERPEFNTFKYASLYLQKGIYGKYKDKEKPFLMMSTRPMIGANAISRAVFISDKIYIDGHYIKTPRAFLRKLEELFPDEVEQLKQNRTRFLSNCRPEVAEDVKELILDDKKKKYSKIFGKSLDRMWRPVYNLKKVIKDMFKWQPKNEVSDLKKGDRV